MEKVEVTVIGAGVIGLAAAVELAGSYRDIYIIERNSSFGRETSSRNSEVIHAGIYYPKNSLKAVTCVEGRHLLYEFCEANNIPHRKIGKLIVARISDETKALEELFNNGLSNGVEDLKMLSRGKLNELEPNIKGEAAIYSPSTGILDTHAFMKKLTYQFKAAGGEIVYNTAIVGITKKGKIFEVTTKDSSGDETKFLSHLIINCAGLDSDKIAAMAGIKKEEYRLKYCKGDYFRAHNNKGSFIKRLVYPVPREQAGGLGIHATLDLAGGLRLGPDDEYVDKIDYSIDESKKELFYKDAVRMLPFLELTDLAPDTSGIRPKLQGPKEPFRDFIITGEDKNDLAGFINLVGIESPGLTAALSIARRVKSIAARY